MAKEELDRQLDALNKHLPRWMAGALDRARKPGAVWLRVPMGLALIAGGFVGFLPILGFWMIPLGLALLALDVPFLRGLSWGLLRFINRKLSSA